MKKKIEYKVQTCNGNPEVIKVIDGRADEIVKVFTHIESAHEHAEELSMRAKIIDLLISCVNGSVEEWGTFRIKHNQHGFTVTDTESPYMLIALTEKQAIRVISDLPNT